MKNIILALALALCAQTAAAETRTFEFGILAGEAAFPPLVTDDFTLEASSVQNLAASANGLAFLGPMFFNLNFSRAVTSVSFNTTQFQSESSSEFQTNGVDFMPGYATVTINPGAQTFVEAGFVPSSKVIPFVDGCNDASCDGKLVYAYGTLISSVTYAYADTTAPVPEPKTYAMMLAGLGLLGFTVRRRITPAG